MASSSERRRNCEKRDCLVQSRSLTSSRAHEFCQGFITVCNKAHILSTHPKISIIKKNNSVAVTRHYFVEHLQPEVSETFFSAVSCFITRICLFRLSVCCVWAFNCATCCSCCLRYHATMCLHPCLSSLSSFLRCLAKVRSRPLLTIHREQVNVPYSSVHRETMQEYLNLNHSN